jgi:hypothetical protein
MLETIQGLDFQNLGFSDIILLALLGAEIIVNLTPSEKDNSVLDKVKKVIRLVFKDIRKKTKEQ